jgi:hypothetical protein
MLPPKNVQPSELWQTLAKRPRPTKTIEFPCKDGSSVGRTCLWILTEDELHTCRKNAREEAVARLGTTAQPSELAYEEIYRNELYVQLACMACRAPENLLVPSFPTPPIARKVLTTDEWGSIVAAYNAFRVEAGPMLSELTPAEMEAWLKTLQEGASRLPLASRLSPEALIDLILFLVSKLTSLQADSGSPGLLQEEPSPQEPEAGTDSSSK